MGSKITVDKLVGQPISTIAGLHKESDRVTFILDGGSVTFYHMQDCCEYVRLVDFDMDFSLDGAVILSAEEVISSDEGGGHQTWTFYKIETTKGGLWMRWLGESNGYYSEEVDILLEGVLV